MRIPTSTYRLQLSPGFNFQHVAAIADYLQQLGITAIYASPLLQPAKGSQHGYDGIDPTTINPELGTEEEFIALSRLLRQKGIGWIQDIVPNHLAYDTSNIWLRDVLERGVNSPYADYFDIDWEHPNYPNKLMVPFLEDELATCIRNGKIKLTYDELGFAFMYYSNRYPANPEVYPELLSGCFDDEFNHVNATINALLNNIRTDADHWQLLKSTLLRELDAANVSGRIEQKLESINNDHQYLHKLLTAQHYVLCLHTISHRQVNFRRFFNVNGLICLRIEDEKVFNDYHAYTHKLYEMGLIDGLRIDHIDGLKDPRGYIDRLRKLFGEDCYIIVEKILDVKEALPPGLNIQGTSGYEFLSYINQVITDREGAAKLLELYRKYVPNFSDYDSTVFQNKFSNLESYLNGEWDNLVRLLLGLNLIEDEEIRMSRLKLALGAFMAGYPVYRAYISEFPIDVGDAAMVSLAFERALSHHPELHYELGVLKQLFDPHPDPATNTNRLFFVQRLMQFTGPIAAKGIEDTTFYQFNALISHNEVGDQPCVLGIPVRTFHEKMVERQQKNPYSFNCTSTHDTKRGEDGRVRINILSELVEEWTALVAQWQNVNDVHRQDIKGTRAPIVNDAYFLYQAIVGGLAEDLQVTNEFIQRTKTYFRKALRESKNMSDHLEPNIAYEEACDNYIDAILAPGSAFLDTLIPFVERLIQWANVYSMIQVIIKTTAPGIPDIYRGCELWDLSYVDPDNRRPVDYVLRKKLLNEIERREKEDMIGLLHWANENYRIGAQKMMVTRKMLQLRKENSELFLEGEYIPLYPSEGDRVGIAYFRRLHEKWILVVLPLGIVNNTGKPLHIELPADAPREWINVFTGEELKGKGIFEKFGVAVFTSQK